MIKSCMFLLHEHHHVKSHVKALRLHNFIRDFRWAYKQRREGQLYPEWAYKRKKEMFRNDEINVPEFNASIPLHLELLPYYPTSLG